MANKLIKRRYNNLLTGRNHYFKFGDFLFKPGDNGVVTNRGLNNLSSLGSGLLGAAGSAVGQIGGGLIGGGLQSGAGDVLQGLSGIAAAIPGPWGAVASAGLGVLGGLTNRMVGSKMNTENIAKVEANINSLNNFQSNASDYDTLAQNWASSPTGMTFSDSFIGKDGWFSNKAKNKAASLRNQIASGNTWVQNSLNNNAMNIGTTQMQNLLSNYAAYGGQLFANGGGIHIKPENRGKFTETKRRTGKTTEELTHSKNPLTRKRAIFAQNARKWHHAFGGDLMTHGANFDTGVTLIGNGGTHEQNPLEGVPMGVDAEGIPNLVEEGEVIFNDYVFSNRLKVPKAVRKKYKLRGTKPLTFADAALQMSKESEERPNDPISQAGLEDSMAKLMSVQEQIREKRGERQFARGGHLFAIGGEAARNWEQRINYNNSTPNLTFGQEGFNPYNSDNTINWDIMYGADSPFMRRRNYVINNWDSDAVQNWLPRYTEAVNAYNRNRAGYTPLTVDGLSKDVFARRTADKHWGGMHAGIDIAGNPIPVAAPAVPREAARRMFLTNRRDASGTPLDNILIPDYDPTTGVYKYVKTDTTSEGNTDYTNVYYEERPKTDSNEDTPDLTGDKTGEYPDYDNILRYAPVLGSVIGLGTSLFTKPDDSDASAILEASSGRGAYRPVRYRPISNYLTYNPFDRDYYINKANAAANASRRALMNTSGGNRATAMAGILAADNNYINQLGDLARQAEEYNLAQRQKNEEFNRATNIQNSQGFLQADMANQEALDRLRDFNLKGVMAAANIRSGARLAREQAISDNLSNIFSSLGDIGREKVDRKWRTWAGKNGVYAQVQKEAAHGGKIKRKKRGLTF